MKRIFLFWFAVLQIALGQSDTVRVMTYNVLNFPGSNGNQRLNDLATVIHYAQPDILIVQEMDSQEGVNLILSVLDSDFHAAPFHDGPDSDNALFYRNSLFAYLGARYFSTSLRDIAEYHVKHMASGEELYLYSIHLKAGQGSSNQQQRLQEMTILKNNLLAHPSETNYIVVGDFNLYKSSEPAYQLVISDSTLLDPIDSPGNWHNNPAFAPIHTQSPRANSFGGGSSGGLDDRFDFILISRSLRDNVLSAQYRAVGNDGNHFNQSINEGTNSAVPATVANALYYGSDHLPVVCPFVFHVTGIQAGGESPRPLRTVLFPNYPNPFNPGTTIRYFLSRNSRVELAVFDVRGAKVATLFSGFQIAGTHRINWSPSSELPGGVYFVRLSLPENSLIRKIVYLK